MKRARADSASRRRPAKPARKTRPLRRWIVLLLFLGLAVYAYRLWLYETPEETSVQPLYKLPFPAGERYRCVKGRGVTPLMSHHGPDFYSIDFGMPVHSLIVAARAGVVTRVEIDSNVSGRSKELMWQANRINITHSDGTQTQYVHLEYHGALVNVGDRVEQGQPIGYSGNTGASMMPHLHFSVADMEKHETIPFAFEGFYGEPIIPKAFLSYTSYNVSPAE
jgi:murein DD-endopeptidase MepM/ murein hydrolase activator NlpD